MARGRWHDRAPATASECSREALKGLVEQYFEGLAAHDPARLPLAPNVRSTENGVEVAVGKRLWRTAGKALLRRILVDTRQCGTHASAVLLGILGGRACIRGMRISVSVLVNQLAHGITREELLQDYPELEPEDIQQALEYAGWLTREKIHPASA